MKTIKTLLAVSVLAAAGAANATVWDLSVSGSRDYPLGTGEMNFVGAGTYDDVANAGSWGGVLSFPLFGLDQTIISQNFTMNEATGNGVLAQYTAANCTDTIDGALCNPMAPVWAGAMRNGSSAVDQWGGDSKPAATGVGFVPVDGGQYVWSFWVEDDAQASTDPETGETTRYWTRYNLNVTLNSQEAPAVPIPAAAWLFGSGLLGLAGTARRRRAAAAA